MQRARRSTRSGGATILRFVAAFIFSTAAVADEGGVSVNLKGYSEFAAQNRPEGRNAWLTVAIPLGEGKK